MLLVFRIMEDYAWYHVVHVNVQCLAQHILYWFVFNHAVTGDYFAHLDVNNRRVDLDQRPELTQGSVEFVAPTEYMVRPPMPPLYFFLIDVSISAVRSGMIEVRLLPMTLQLILFLLAYKFCISLVSSWLPQEIYLIFLNHIWEIDNEIWRSFLI